jgi:hypothetical protein
MEALGRALNTQYLMNGLWINMKYCSGVTFLCYNVGAETYTLQNATTAAGGGAANLATITRYWTCTGNGSDTWTLNTQAAAATVVTGAAATANCMVVEVDGVELADGFDYLNLTSTGGGIVVAITRDLTVQRLPSNLPAMSA